MLGCKFAILIDYFLELTARLSRFKSEHPCLTFHIDLYPDRRIRRRVHCLTQLSLVAPCI